MEGRLTKSAQATYDFFVFFLDPALAVFVPACAFFAAQYAFILSACFFF